MRKLAATLPIYIDVLLEYRYIGKKEKKAGIARDRSSDVRDEYCARKVSQ